ncbi:MAG TPA: SDR family oxidoreductase [Pseudomonadales bacterium]|nr:SDR family oxidoreductase [Pseudomonadales bacterium]
MKIAVVTGTSTGIGFATAMHLARNGYRVFAGMRNLAKAGPLQEMADGDELPLEVIQLDVTSGESIAAAFARVHEAGPVDVLVNNAGIGGSTPLELTPEDEHRQIFDTNYFGAMNCIQQVLPSMRERETGCIVNITSVEGRLAVPDQVAYSASKWALDAAGEALAHEVYRFGVRVVNVEPGVIMTSIFDNSADMTRYDKHSPYKQIMRRNGKMFMSGFKRNTQPQEVADVILEAITTPNYKLRWPVGADAFGMIEGRAKISDEDWIALGGDLTDEEYNGKFKEWFDVEL